MILLWTVPLVADIVMIANEEPQLAAVFIAGTHLTRALALVIAALWFGSVDSLIYAALIQGTLQTAALTWYLCRRFPSFWIRYDWSLMQSQLSYALPHGLAILLAFLQMDIHHYFVSNQFDASVYAIYAVGTFQLPLVGILHESVGSVLIPRVSQLQAQNALAEIRQLVARVIRMTAGLLFPLYGLLVIVGPEFIRILFTDQYLASWPIFAINLTLIPLSVVAVACDAVIRAHMEHRYLYTRVRAVLSPLAVVGLWFFTARFHLLGAISVVVGIMTIERVVIGATVARILHMSRRDLSLFSDVGKLALAAAVAAMVTAGARFLCLPLAPWLILMVCVTVYVPIYVIMIHLLNIVTPHERATVGTYVPIFLGKLLGTTAPNAKMIARHGDH